MEDAGRENILVIPTSETRLPLSPLVRALQFVEALEARVCSCLSIFLMTISWSNSSMDFCPPADILSKV
jgi:hypothetical protein